MQNQSLSNGLETVFGTKPGGGWPVIYADPPWSFKTYSAKGEGRSAKKHYGVMRLSEICALPINDIAARNAHLFLWTTAPHFVESLAVVTAWGFTYSTIGFTWIKTSKKAPRTIFNEKALHWGMGRTTRANAEFVIYARRGKPSPVKRHDVHSVIIDRVREHSRKPDTARERIEQLYDGPYLELFARQQSEGWTAWGNQSDKFEAGS
jgi:N6-adenosine-specific RNA methylase IME4